MSSSTPFSTNITASSASSPDLLRRISLRSISTCASANSLWLATEVYSPAAIENDPAASPASPASTIGLVSLALLPPTTPMISAKLDTRPSMAPNTAGRSQPPVTSGCSCSIWSGSGRGSVRSTASVMLRRYVDRRISSWKDWLSYAPLGPRHSDSVGSPGTSVARARRRLTKK